MATSPYGVETTNAQINQKPCLSHKTLDQILGLINFYINKLILTLILLFNIITDTRRAIFLFRSIRLFKNIMNKN